jgi:light-regulated signal transduction histidine kinase (bacteriophytochrome)
LTAANGKRVYFIRDNGIGFDMADATGIFAPFQRLPGADGLRGFGIGLATVERIVLRHGGDIWVEGKSGEGSTFFFSLGEDQASTVRRLPS